MKATVSIPDPVFKAADDLAQRMAISRSHLYCVAIQRFVQDHDDEAITAKRKSLTASHRLSIRSFRAFRHVPLVGELPEAVASDPGGTRRIRVGD